MELNLMSPEETDRLAELEAIIKRDMQGFVRVGLALKEIFDKNLYRGKYTTWKDYLKAEWDMGKSYADYQIKAAGTIGNLEEKFHNCGTFESEEFDYTVDFILPKNEAQTRPLTLLSKEQQPDAWKLAVLITNGKPTALAVTKVVQEILEAQLDEDKKGLQDRLPKEVNIPDDFSEQFNRLIEVLSMHRKSGWKEFNRKKALEYLHALEEYLNS